MGALWATGSSSRGDHVPGDAEATPISRPGTMPARKSLVIETPAATPKTTKPIEGGMTGAMMPPTRSGRRAVDIGSRPAHHRQQDRAASAAVSATAEPESSP
jgi:hypothetical protein